MTVFWKAAMSSLVEINRRFGVSYFLHHETDRIALTMEAVNTSSSFYQTTLRNIAKDRHFTYRLENLKSHKRKSGIWNEFF